MEAIGRRSRGANKYDDYTQAEIEMFRFTHTAISPWIVVRANDQRRARLETIRHVLLSIEYEGRDLKAIGKADPLIIGSGPEFFPSPRRSASSLRHRFGRRVIARAVSARAQRWRPAQVHARPPTRNHQTPR